MCRISRREALTARILAPELPYFNTALFSTEALGQFGDANRRFFHGLVFNNFEMALLKDLRLTETNSFKFRAEWFRSRITLIWRRRMATSTAEPSG